MRNDTPRRPPMELDQRIRELTLRILLDAVIAAAEHDPMETAWEEFRQN
jgi:hypothetical protein